MKIITKAHRESGVYFQLLFDRIPYDGGGWAFDCDEKGNLKPVVQYDAKRALAQVLEKVDAGTVAPGRIAGASWTRFVHATGECSCGREVYLSHFTNECDCGLDYNQSGQQLAPRSEWGQETGEHWTECV